MLTNTYEENWRVLVLTLAPVTTAAWRNGIASDYESGDCRFDPCGGHLFLFFPPKARQDHFG